VSSQGTLLYGIGNRHADATLYPFNGDLSKLGDPTLKVPVTGSVSWLLGGGTMRFSPDGKRLLAVGISSRELIIHSLVSNTHQTITPRLKQLTRVEWAPDGVSILVLGMNEEGQHGILRLDPSSGATTFVTPLPERTWNFVPSPDGRMIYYGRPNQVVARDLATGQDKQVWNGDGGGNFQLLISRNGKTLIVRASGYLGAVDLTTGQVRPLYDRTKDIDVADGVVWASTFSPDETKVFVIHRAGSLNSMQFGVYPIDGSTPSRFPAPKEFRGLHVSPDGKLLGTTFLTRRDQIWALENFLPAAGVVTK
jgi:WD40 repeat protein